MIREKKVLFPIVIAIFAMLLLSLAYNLILKKEGMHKEDLLKLKPFDPKVEKKATQQYQYLRSAIKDPSFELTYPNRNIFTVKKEIIEEPLFYLESIENIKIPMIFKGSIVRGDDVVIAQINLDNRTFFVKPNEVVQGWKVTHIQKEFIRVIDPSGAASQLDLNKPSFSQKKEATLLFSRTNLSYKVKIGDTVLGYEVQDIRHNEVILKDSESILTVRPKKD